MRLADQTLSIADFRRLGAFEIYREAEVVAFVRGSNITPGEDTAAVADDLGFRIGEVFASPTKLLRLLWLARRPGVLPAALLRRFAHAVATRCAERLADECELSDIRLRAGLSAHREYLDGSRHLRSLDLFRDSANQAVLDHMRFGSERAADGCRSVAAALDPDAWEAGAGAAMIYLALFPDIESEGWLRSQLRELVDQSA